MLSGVSGKDLPALIDEMKARLGSGAVLLIADTGAKPAVAAGVTQDLTAKLSAVTLVKAAAEAMGGKGGIVADMGGAADDDMFRDAVHVVVENRKASTSLLQRKLRIGYGRAARLIEQMEEQGIIGQADGSRPREVLVSSVESVFGGGTEADDALDENFPDDEKE
mgnify:CR=1 FL=1